MAWDHGMMLMSDHDDAYVNAMLMVNMQANTRSVTENLFQNIQNSSYHPQCFICLIKLKY